MSITRDDWGIAHISAPTDANAVFGMIYAQAEDDFSRIEANYLTALGRTAEADGERAIWQDLRARLYVSEEKLRADYARSPEWLKRLMDSWANGLNCFLATRPQVKRRALTRFEPWMALSFTEGSIGSDIDRIDLVELEKFYSGQSTQVALIPDAETKGSNGIAIAPPLTKNGNALLLINPHTNFFFRSEQHVASGQGLNVYGAATWGQFFIYQGFNANAGWMHTSSGLDRVDEFAYQVRRRAGKLMYRFGNQWRPLRQRRVTIRFKSPGGKMAVRTFTTYGTHRGPIVRASNGRWIAIAMMDLPVDALQQSFLRTKATDFASFMRVAELRANSSNATVFADSKGTIAYLHPQFVPLRDDRFDYTKPIDGSDPATVWRGVTALTALPSAVAPTTGWIQNNNDWPWAVAGVASPNPSRFPKYMDVNGENYRGIHASQLLTGSRGWTLEKLQAAAFDSLQPGFAELVPLLLKAYDALPPGSSLMRNLASPIATLRSWDFRWSANSVAQSLAMVWAEELQKTLPKIEGEVRPKMIGRIAGGTTGSQKLQALSGAVRQLERDFGRWQVPWGEINRFQRISPAIIHPFNDAQPSIPVPFASGIWGSLASFRSAPMPGTTRWYGTHGNSFVAVVEFGPRVRARAVIAGGESGDPGSPHFNDQALGYATGNLREVYFYPDQLRGHTARRYRPGN